MPNTEFENVWVRLAVNRQAWDRGDPKRWRVFVDPDISEILVRDRVVNGASTARNNIARTLDKRDERDIIAFIHYYGNLKVIDDVAYITLLDPVK